MTCFGSSIPRWCNPPNSIWSRGAIATALCVPSSASFVITLAASASLLLCSLVDSYNPVFLSLYFVLPTSYVFSRLCPPGVYFHKYLIIIRRSSIVLLLFSCQVSTSTFSLTGSSNIGRCSTGSDSVSFASSHHVILYVIFSRGPSSFSTCSISAFVPCFIIRASLNLCTHSLMCSDCVVVCTVCHGVPSFAS